MLLKVGHSFVRLCLLIYNQMSQKSVSSSLVLLPKGVLQRIGRWVSMSVGRFLVGHVESYIFAIPFRKHVKSYMNLE